MTTINPTWFIKRLISSIKLMILAPVSKFSVLQLPLVFISKYIEVMIYYHHQAQSKISLVEKLTFNKVT